jgi:hypothetical protein
VLLLSVFVISHCAIRKVFPTEYRRHGGPNLQSSIPRAEVILHHFQLLLALDQTHQE